MLVEIHCDEFMSYGKPRKPIIFHEGLNTVLGGQSADNSIGKSMLLNEITGNYKQVDRRLDRVRIMV